MQVVRASVVEPVAANGPLVGGFGVTGWRGSFKTAAPVAVIVVGLSHQWLYCVGGSGFHVTWTHRAQQWC